MLKRTSLPAVIVAPLVIMAASAAAPGNSGRWRGPAGMRPSAAAGSRARPWGASGSPERQSAPVLPMHGPPAMRIPGAGAAPDLPRAGPPALAPPPDPSGAQRGAALLPPIPAPGPAAARAGGLHGVSISLGEMAWRTDAVAALLRRVRADWLRIDARGCAVPPGPAALDQALALAGSVGIRPSLVVSAPAGRGPAAARAARALGAAWARRAARPGIWWELRYGARDPDGLVVRELAGGLRSVDPSALIALAAPRGLNGAAAIGALRSARPLIDALSVDMMWGREIEWVAGVRDLLEALRAAGSRVPLHLVGEPARADPPMNGMEHARLLRETIQTASHIRGVAMAVLTPLLDGSAATLGLADRRLVPRAGADAFAAAGAPVEPVGLPTVFSTAGAGGERDIREVAVDLVRPLGPGPAIGVMGLPAAGASAPAGTAVRIPLLDDPSSVQIRNGALWVDWERIDAVCEQVTRQALHPTLVFSRVPVALTDGRDRWTPRDASAWGSLVQTVVERCVAQGVRGARWEAECGPDGPVGAGWRATWGVFARAVRLADSTARPGGPGCDAGDGTVLASFAAASRSDGAPPAYLACRLGGVRGAAAAVRVASEARLGLSVTSDGGSTGPVLALIDAAARALLDVTLFAPCEAALIRAGERVLVAPSQTDDPAISALAVLTDQGARLVVARSGEAVGGEERPLFVRARFSRIPWPAATRCTLAREASGTSLADAAPGGFAARFPLPRGGKATLSLAARAPSRVWLSAQAASDVICAGDVIEVRALSANRGVMTARSSIAVRGAEGGPLGRLEARDTPATVAPGRVHRCTFRVRTPVAAPPGPVLLEVGDGDARSAVAVWIVSPASATVEPPARDLLRPDFLPDSLDALARFRVVIANRSGSPLPVRIEGSLDVAAATVAPRDEATLSVMLSAPGNTPGIHTVPVAITSGGRTVARVAAQIGVPALARRTLGTLMIDGDLREWSRAYPTPIGGAGTTGGVAGRSSAVAMAMWDERALYVAGSVESGPGPSGAFSGDRALGDLLSLGIDPSRDARFRGETTPMGWRALALTGEAGGRVRVDAGPPDIDGERPRAAVRRAGGRTVFEVALPWRWLGRSEPQIGDVLGWVIGISSGDPPRLPDPASVTRAGLDPLAPLRLVDAPDP